MWSKPHDAVGDEVRLLAVVRHVDRRRPLIAQERPHVDSEAVAQVPVQRAKGLIEEEEARAGGQGSCQGDALCLADKPYQAFRLQARTPEWQHAFLSKPLAEREEFARSLRALSESQKHEGMSFADADPAMSLFWLHHTQADEIIHGHTHKPATHPLGAGKRQVLSDWSLDHAPHRAQVYRLHRDGPAQRLNLI